MRESSFQVELDRVAKELGADLFGVADLIVARNFVFEQGGDHLKKFSKGINRLTLVRRDCRRAVQTRRSTSHLHVQGPLQLGQLTLRPHRTFTGKKDTE